MIQSTTNLLIMLLPALLFSAPQHGAPYPVSAANDDPIGYLECYRSPTASIGIVCVHPVADQPVSSFCL